MKIEIPKGVNLYKAIEIAKEEAHKSRWGENGWDVSRTPDWQMPKEGEEFK